MPKLSGARSWRDLKSPGRGAWLDGERLKGYDVVYLFIYSTSVCGETRVLEREGYVLDCILR